MAETAKNLRELVSAERLTTVQYPEERIAPIEATRDFPSSSLTWKPDGGGPEWRLECAASPARYARRNARQVHIHREVQRQEAGLPRQGAYYPARFDIDISVCMSCQICVEVCPFEAIKMDTEFELSTTDRFGGSCLTGTVGEA